MGDRKITFIIVTLFLYTVYSVHVWVFQSDVKKEGDMKTEDTQTLLENDKNKFEDIAVKNDFQDVKKDFEDMIAKEILQENDDAIVKNVKSVENDKIYIKKAPTTGTVIKNSLRNKHDKKDTCSALDIFFTKPNNKNHHQKYKRDSKDYPAAVIVSVVTLLLILILNAIHDVVTVKKEEQEKRKHPELERRQSLAEFANRKPIKRQSSKGSDNGQSNDPPGLRNMFPHDPGSWCVRKKYTIGYGTSFIDLMPQAYEMINGLKKAEASSDPGTPQKHGARFSGMKPTLTRRCSFPVQHPDVQALKLQQQGIRRPSLCDTEDEGSPARRVRLIRRY